MKDQLASAGDLAYLLYPFVPVRWMISMARLEGRLRALLRRRQAETVRQNLESAFGDEWSPAELDRMTRQFFEYERIRALLVMLSPGMSLEELTAMFSIEGVENLDRALERGKGVMLLGSHINSVCMFIAITMLRAKGYEIGVALPEPGDAWARTRLRKWIDRRGEGRQTVGEAIGGFYCQFNVRPIVRRLAQNQIVGQTGDGLHSARFVEAKFLSRELPFTTGSASLAQLTGASIVPIFQLGSPDGGMRFVLEEPLTVEPGSAEDLGRVITTWVGRLEHHLRQNIPCWQHWLIPNTLEAMAEWPRRALKERYEVTHSGTDL